MKRKISLLMALVFSLAFISCTGCSEDKDVSKITASEVSKTMATTNSDTNAIKAAIDAIDFSQSGNTADFTQIKSDLPIVAMKVGDIGVMVIELYPSVAPNTVNNFISLIKSGFYDNNCFHRAQAGFVVQGGDPAGNGTGGPGYSIKGEFSNNGFDNNLKHTLGVLSMARATPYDSAGSQFFVMLGSSPHLDGDYAAFGKVIYGMDVVYTIVENGVTVDGNGKLKDNVTITKVLVDTQGVDYPAPKKAS